jgi:Rrf2 family protein
MKQVATTLGIPVPFSVGSGYALQALAVMPEDGSYSTASGLAALLQLPGPFLAKVLKTLAQGGLLQSVRGPRGGFRLVRPAHCITVRDVLDVLDGDLALPGCQMGSPRRDCRDHPCVLHRALVDLKTYMDSSLFQVTIRDLQVQHLCRQRELAAAQRRPNPQGAGNITPLVPLTPSLLGEKR